jgi:hypothetical protein
VGNNVLCEDKTLGLSLSLQKKKKAKQSKETITIYHNVSIPSQAPAPSICFKKLILLTAIVNKPIS